MLEKSSVNDFSLILTNRIETLGTHLHIWVNQVGLMHLQKLSQLVQQEDSMLRGLLFMWERGICIPIPPI